MAIDYTEAAVAWDAKCDYEERWLKEHADRTCGECKHFTPCPCGCGYGGCLTSDNTDGGLVYKDDTVKDYENFCWEE